MSDAKSQAEPTMEEILASIRRIISEEGDDPEATTVKVASRPEPVDDPMPPPAPPPPPPPPRREPEPPVDDVLTLTEMVGDDGSVTSLDPEGEDDWQPEPPPPPPRYEPPPRAAAPPPAGNSRLTSPSTAAMASAAFGEISSRLGMPRSPRAAGGRTVEELVEDVVRPMLQAWLDENLPAMVERLVAEEIQRLSGR